MSASCTLLVIDPQNDFCDLPDDRCPPHERPSLPVPGAHADMQRLARWLDAHTARLDQIAITLDSHHHLDIAHPGFWRQTDAASGALTAVQPFTTITAAAVRAGRYQPRHPSETARALRYLEALEARQRYELMVWPVHCEIGSWGHAVHGDLRDSYNRWEATTGRGVQKWLKGQNPWTEHYSALLAEVPDALDPATELNHALLAQLGGSSRIFIAGEASSHCVRATVHDLWEHLPAERLVLLSDCLSPVQGFEAVHREFLDQARERGTTVLRSDEVAP